MSITRRKIVKTGAAGVALGALGLPALSLGADSKVVKIGMNIPMTGDYAAWGLPGLYGSKIVAASINAKGGIKVGGDNYKIEIASFDHAYETGKAIQGYKKLVLDDEVKMVMMLGGPTVASVMPWAQRRKMLTTTLLPSDITPKTQQLLAVCESHPLYNVTGVEWLAENFPKAQSAVICTTNDIEYGKQSAATYAAAFEVAGIDVLATKFHGFDVTDFAPLVSSLLAKKPDVFCIATDVFTTPLIEQLYQQGFKGKIISCTLDLYEETIAKTSKEYLEGLIFQFPDFDDPALQSNKQVYFPNPPANEFAAAFNKDHSGEWSAVAWEYPSILQVWADTAVAAGSIEPMDVLETLKGNPKPPHTFGDAHWWGKELWGLDNAIVGNWPVVVMKGGKARVVEFKSLYDWLEKHGDVLKKHMQKLDLRTV